MKKRYYSFIAGKLRIIVSDDFMGSRQSYKKLGMKNFIIIVMDFKDNKDKLSQSHTKQNSRKNKVFKTLCTIDTSEIELRDHKFKDNSRTSLNKKNPGFKNKRLLTIDYDCSSQMKKNTKKYTTVKASSKLMKVSTPLQKNSTLKNFYEKQNTMKRSTTKKSRMKTDYSCDFFKTFEKSASKLKPQIFYPFDNQYRYDVYDIVRKLKTNNKNEKVFLVVDPNKKQFIMKKTKNLQTKEAYDAELSMREKLKNIKSKNLIKLLKHYHEKDEYVTIYEHYGTCLDWKNHSHLQIIKKILKNDGVVLKHMIKEIAKGINQLSQKKFIHGALSLENIFMRISETKNNVKVEGSIKIGNLHRCFKLSQKHRFMEMEKKIYTPPQILNFMRFQQHNTFDRELIEYIGSYQYSWSPGVWSLGVIILELLNCEKFQLQKNLKLDFSETKLDIRLFDDEDEEIFQPNLRELVDKQKNLLKECQGSLSLLDFDENLKQLVMRMLSVNPLSRPSPQQIVSQL